MSARFPPAPAAPAPAEALDADQRRYVEDARGAQTGPFWVFLRNPDLHRRLQPIRQRLRAQTAVGPALQEMAILMVGAHWRSDGMLRSHAPMARAAGLDAPTVEALVRGQRPAGLDGAAATLHDFTAALLTTGSAGDSLFGETRAAFGEAGLLDLVALVGFYGIIAMALNLDRPDAPLEEHRT